MAFSIVRLQTHLSLPSAYPGSPSVFLTVMPNIFIHIYKEAPGIAGLHYIALGVGLAIGCYFNALLMDRIYIHYKNKSGVGEPEYRLRELLSFLFSDAVLTPNFPATMVPASIILPVGLILAGWAAQHHLHWVVTDIVR